MAGEYVFSNPHPDGKLVSDCVKRAICLASGMDYKETCRLLNRIKREIGEKDFNTKKCCDEYVKGFGWKKLSFPAEKGKSRDERPEICRTASHRSLYFEHGKALELLQRWRDI